MAGRPMRKPRKRLVLWGAFSCEGVPPEKSHVYAWETVDETDSAIPLCLKVETLWMSFYIQMLKDHLSPINERLTGCELVEVKPGGEMVKLEDVPVPAEPPATVRNQFIRMKETVMMKDETLKTETTVRATRDGLAVLRAIQWFWGAHKVPPEDADLLRLCGEGGGALSRRTLQRRLCELYEAGMIEHAAGRGRGNWRLTEKGRLLLAEEATDGSSQP